MVPGVLRCFSVCAGGCSWPLEHAGVGKYGQGGGAHAEIGAVWD
jgi:hypothetical protein